MMRNPEKYSWMTHIKDLLCSHGFENIWRDQSVVNGKLFLANIEQRCIADMNSSNKCRTYREIKAVYKCETYLDCNIRHDLRMFYTKFRLSSHKFLIERTRWHKSVIPYHERTCTLCNQHDILW